MNFTEDWTTPHTELWMKHLGHLRGVPDSHAIEIGSFEGKSTIWFLKNILTDERSRLICIDTFEGGDDQRKFGTKLDGLYHRFRSNIDECNLADKTQVFRMASVEALHRLPRLCHDFIYVDGSHIAKDVLEDLVLSWPLLKNNGIMILDDYGWNLDPDRLNRPRPAIDAFLDIYSQKLEILHKGWQVIVRKTK